MKSSEYSSQRSGGIYSELLLEEFPQVLSSCRVSEPREFELGIETDSGGDKIVMRYFDEDEILAVDRSFFDFFSFNLLHGNKDLIFTEGDHMVITESLAIKLFDKVDVLDKTVRIGEGGYYRIVGIVEDLPEESSYQLQVLMGFQIMEQQGYPPDGETRGVIGFYLNLIMSLVILSIACINFTTLTTAYSSGRVKEIFIRRSAGASKFQLVAQFIGETYLLLLFSLYLGLFIAEHLTPEAARSFGVSLQNAMVGLYPAIKIVGSEAVAFSGTIAGSKPQGKSGSRKVLFVLQFTFSLVVIIITVFIVRQYAFLKEADLGFNREDVLYIRTKGKA